MHSKSFEAQLTELIEKEPTILAKDLTEDEREDFYCAFLSHSSDVVANFDGDTWGKPWEYKRPILLQGEEVEDMARKYYNSTKDNF